MKKNILVLLLIVISTASKGQESVHRMDHYLNFDNEKVASLEILYDDTDKGLFLVQSKSTLNAYLMNDQFEEIGDGLHVALRKGKYPNIQGFITSTDGKYHVFTTNNDFNKWGVVTLDFQQKTAIFKPMLLKFKKEFFLKSFSYGGKHWAVTLLKNSSTFRIYEINASGGYKSVDYDLSNNDFSGGRRSIRYITQLVKTSSENFLIDFIQNDTPVSLRSTNEKMKLYAKEGVLTITIDNSRDYTYLINIEPEKQVSNVKILNKPAMQERSSFEDSNTFIFDNKLYTLKSTFEELIITITDLENDTVLKSFSVLSEDNISFKNTPIIKERGGRDTNNDLSSTAALLRKITNSEPAISVHKQEKNIVMTIGASKDVDDDTGAVVAGALLFGVTGAVIVGSLSNPVSQNYLDYASTKTVRFQTVLDNSFNHLMNTSVNKNPFDQIKKYDQREKIRQAKTVFKLKDNYYFSFWTKEEDTINIIKF